MKKTVLILGATSAIARAVAGALAKEGYPLFLGGREKEELERIAQDLKIRYKVNVLYDFFDASQYEQNDTFFNKVLEETHGLDGVVMAFGTLGEHQKAIYNFPECMDILNRNFVGACSILSLCANYMEKEKRGFIVGISSVAGDRGRQSNYIYGAAKGGLSIFLQGLRNRLYHSNVHVMTVKPGFVDTAMTFGSPNLFLVATPEYVGESIVNSLKKGRNEIYVPWYWRYIMGVIKSIPESLFKKLKL